jgi:hypothetical protein
MPADGRFNLAFKVLLAGIVCLNAFCGVGGVDGCGGGGGGIVALVIPAAAAVVQETLLSCYS